jgi:hypothetical protein
VAFCRTGLASPVKREPQRTWVVMIVLRLMLRER